MHYNTPRIVHQTAPIILPNRLLRVTLCLYKYLKYYAKIRKNWPCRLMVNHFCFWSLLILKFELFLLDRHFFYEDQCVLHRVILIPTLWLEKLDLIPLLDQLEHLTAELRQLSYIYYLYIYFQWNLSANHEYIHSSCTKYYTTQEQCKKKVTVYFLPIL